MIHIHSRTSQSAHRRHFSTFGEYLKTTVVAAALLTGALVESEGKQYVNAGGSMNSNPKVTRASWRNDIEFNATSGSQPDGRQFVDAMDEISAHGTTTGFKLSRI